jgi:hypothetical protein
MYKFILVFIFSLPVLGFAHQRRLDIGVSVPIYIKFNPLSGEDVYKRIFGAVGLDAVIKLDGIEESDMAFLFSAGLFSDRRKFHSDLETKLITSLYFLSINPSVTIASKWSNIRYQMGFGTLVHLDQNVSIVGNDQIGGGIYTTPQEVDSLLNKSYKPVIPFLSFSLLVDITKHCKLQCTLQPTLLNYYIKGTTVNFRRSNTSSDFVMDYQPIYFGVKLYCFM